MKFLDEGEAYVLGSEESNHDVESYLNCMSDVQA